MSDTTSDGCPHPGAYVHAFAGEHRPPTGDQTGDSPPITFRPAPDSPRRPGEHMSAALGRCGACGATVVSVDVWHPDDTDGELTPYMRTPWIELAAVKPSPWVRMGAHN